MPSKTGSGRHWASLAGRYWDKDKKSRPTTLGGVRGVRDAGSTVGAPDGARCAGYPPNISAAVASRHSPLASSF